MVARETRRLPTPESQRRKERPPGTQGSDPPCSQSKKVFKGVDGEGVSWAAPVQRPKGSSAWDEEELSSLKGGRKPMDGGDSHGPEGGRGGKRHTKPVDSPTFGRSVFIWRVGVDNGDKKHLE